MGVINRIQHAWNAFLNRDPTSDFRNVGISNSYRPDRVLFSGGNEKSIVTSIYNRMAMDAADIDIRHVRLDSDGRYSEDMKSDLNDCLSIEANIDQGGRAFRQDIYASLLDEGCIAIVPVDTTTDPDATSSYDILSMRTGQILEWRPDSVKVKLYNDRTGKKEEIWLNKSRIAIVENPLYAIINQRNSTMQRLIRKLNLLDAIDEQSSSGKLDLIIQLPYTIKSQSRKLQAEQRRSDIETQLTGSKYGIAYTDATERITQLNRPIENNLMKQIEYLTSMLYSQLGITQSVMDGTADDKTMTNYYYRTIGPMVSAVTEEFRRKFLSKTARSQGQSIMYFRDPFKLVPMTEMAEMADKFTRNEILSSNEIRQGIGIKPSKDPKADQLVNSNINQKADNQQISEAGVEERYEEGESQNGEI